MNQRDAVMNRVLVEDETCREVVQAIQDKISISNQRSDIVRSDNRGDALDPNVRVTAGDDPGGSQSATARVGQIVAQSPQAGEPACGAAQRINKTAMTTNPAPASVNTPGRSPNIRKESSRPKTGTRNLYPLERTAPRRDRARLNTG